MKVCYLNHDLKDSTGAGRFCLSLIKEIKNILTESQITVLTSEASDHNLEKPILKSGVMGAVFSLPKIRRVFKKCDVIHALDGWPYGVLAMLAGFGLKKKIIITAIGSGAVAPLYSFWRRVIISWAYRRATKLTAISHNTKKEILKILPDLKITVINHGVDFNKFSYFAKASQDKQVTKYKPYILSVGTLKKRKGYEYSIAAFAKIAPEFLDLKYVIFGADNSKEKKEYARLNQIAEELGVKNQVIFLSKKISDAELTALYKNAELFILLPQDAAKDIEGFGLVFLEAAACGLPVVSAKDTSAEDAVLDGKNGILVSAQDTAAAAEAIKQILSDKKLSESFKQASLEFAQKMSWHKTATAYAELYI
ncbi:MAG: glycosyltransferase family 4 protein [bacterium]|nr:glycosyltransferase family 4 protein [bacterium]